MEDNNRFAWAAQYLTPGETILWKGAAGSGGLLSKYDIFLIPFSILWGGFAFFWEYQVLSMGAPIFFSLFGLFFCLMGFYIIFGRFLLALFFRRRTSYVITNHRILQNRSGTISILNARQTVGINVKSGKNGRGTIRFNAQRAGSFLMDFYRPLLPIYNEVALEDIPDVSQVLRLIASMDR